MLLRARRFLQDTPGGNARKIYFVFFSLSSPMASRLVQHNIPGSKALLSDV